MKEEDTFKIKNFLYELSSKYNVGVVFEDLVGKNKGATDGSNVYLGKFNCIQKMFFSYFHEIAHIQLKRETKKLFNFNIYPLEILCWAEALKESARNNIFYEDNVIQWGLDQVKSYHNWSKRELTKKCYKQEFGNQLDWIENILRKNDS